MIDIAGCNRLSEGIDLTMLDKIWANHQDAFDLKGMSSETKTELMPELLSELALGYSNCWYTRDVRQLIQLPPLIDNDQQWLG